ncbi:MAG: hypothetical protein ABI599_05710 [Flavobacteriales bacterium]
MRNQVLGAVLMLLAMSARAQTTESTGYHGLMRVENEYKLNVPDTMADAVWQWMVVEFGPGGPALRSMDSTFSSKIATDRMVDQYFDNDRWQLLHSGNGVRLRSRQVLSDSTDRKNGRKLMQVKINNVDSNQLNRGEYKFKVDTLLTDTASTDPRERHPFLGLVAPLHRDSLLATLLRYGIAGDSLHATLLLDQLRRRIYLLRDTIPFATLSLDEVSAHFGDKSHYGHELELELNEIRYTAADSGAREAMELANGDIMERVLRRWPMLRQDQTPKYKKAWVAMGLDPAVQAPLPGPKSNWWLFGGGGFAVLIAALAARRRKRRPTGGS